MTSAATRRDAGEREAGERDAVEDRVERAARTCAASGARLTDIRRRVLALVLRSEEPVGAYVLLDRLKADKANATPVTVYRALEFLRSHELVHKLERLNAFVGCSEDGEHAHHAAQFLICVTCGGVTELEDDGISQAVRSAAAQAGFRARQVMVEVEGVCGGCGG